MNFRRLIQRGLILWMMSFFLAMPVKVIASENDITILKKLIEEFSYGQMTSIQATSLAKVVYFESRKRKIDPLLVLAVIHEESSFRVRAVSPAGAIGLMQIMPDTGREIASNLNYRSHQRRDLFDPTRNIRIGVWYLRWLKKKFNHNHVLFLTAYNMGLGRLIELQKEMPDSKLRFTYARSVLATYREVKERYRNLKQLYAHNRKLQF